MRSVLSLLLLFVASVCNAQIQVGTTSAFSIEGLTNQSTNAGLILSSTAPTKVVPVGILDVITDASKIVVTATDALHRAVELKSLSTNQFLWTAAGKVDFSITVVDFDKKIFEQKTVSAQIIDPNPVDPVDPDPVDPDPPDEKLENLSVLIVYESAKLSAYAPEITATINSTDLRKWLSDKIGKTNGVPNWRVLDKDSTVPGGLTFGKWLALPRESLPWVIIGNEKKVAFAGPVTNVEAIKQTVLKFKAVK